VPLPDLPKIILLCLAPGLLVSCAVVPGQSHVPEQERKLPPGHFYNVPREPDLSGSHLLSLPKLNPLWWGKNSDNPLPGWWMPDEEDPLKRKRTWYRRNPMHNFTHYVIGVADRDFHRAGTHAPGVWDPDGGWNLAVTHSGPFIHLPFVSHRGNHFESYLGWRNAGNFGMAFRRAEPSPETE
jgi:hypothetical protein